MDLLLVAVICFTVLGTLLGYYFRAWVTECKTENIKALVRYAVSLVQVALPPPNENTYTSFDPDVWAGDFLDKAHTVTFDRESVKMWFSAALIAGRTQADMTKIAAGVRKKRK